MPTLPSAADLGVQPVRPDLGVASYRGETGLEGAAAAGVSAAGGQLREAASYLEKAQDEHDRMSAEDALNKHKAELIRRQWDEKEGWSNKLGEAATNPEQIKQHLESLKAAQEQIASTLSPGAKRYFVPQANASRLHNEAAFYGHVSQQRIQQEINIFESGRQLIIDEVARTPFGKLGDQQMAASMDELRTKSEVFYLRRGFSGEEAANMTNENISALVGARVDAALRQNNPAEAKRIFDENKKLLGAKGLAAMEANVNKAYKNHQAFGIASDVAASVVQKARDIDAAPQSETGPTRSLVEVVKDIESGGGKYLKNPHTSSSGPMGITDATWKEMGPGPRGDPAEEMRRGTEYLGRIQKHLQTQLGRAPENWEVYIGYQQGPGGGTALLKADPSARAVDVLTPLYKGDRAIAERAITLNGGTANMTAGQFVQHWRGEYSKRESSTGGRGVQSPNATDTSMWLRTQLQPAYEAASKAWLEKNPGDRIGADAAGNEARNQVAKEINMREEQNKVSAETLGTLALSLEKPEGARPASQAEFEALLTPDQRRLWDTAHVGQKRVVLSILHGNQSARTGKTQESDPNILNDVMRKVTNNEITSLPQLMPYMSIPGSGTDAGRPGISAKDYGHIASLIRGFNEKEGQSPFDRKKKMALVGLNRALSDDMVKFNEATSPGFTGRALLLWDEEVERRQKEYVAAKKDPSLLFDQKNPDGVASVEFLQSVIDRAANKPNAMITEEQKRAAVVLPEDPAARERMIAELPDNTLMQWRGQYRWKRGQQTVAQTGEVSPPASQPAPEKVREPKFLDTSNDAQYVASYKRVWNDLVAKPYAATVGAATDVIEAAASIPEMIAAVPEEVRRRNYATVFRNYVKSGRYYTPAFLPFIEGALSSGLLTPEEEAVAKKMKANITKIK